MASPSTTPKVRRDGTVLIEGDGSVGAHTVDYENGDTAFGLEKESRTVVRDRGTIVAVRKNDDPVYIVTFSVHQREFTNGSNAVILDVAQFTGAWSGQGSTTDVVSDFNMVSITLTEEGTDHGDSVDGTIKFLGCILICTGFSEADPNQLAFTAECYGGFSRTGQA